MWLEQTEQGGREEDEVGGTGRGQIREAFVGHCEVFGLYYKGNREIEDLRECGSQEGLPGRGVT